MSKTQIPKVAGVLLIGPGVVQVVLSTCVLLLFFVSIDSLIRIAWGYSIGYAIILGPLIISGAFAIVGGTYAQKEKLWSLILTGVIFALFPCVVGNISFLARK